MTDVTNSLRAHWAELCIQRFIELTGTDREDSLGDLLCDLMHWAKQNRFDYEAAAERASGHFQAELADERLVVKPYSVLLLYPDYLQDEGNETYYALVEASDAPNAARAAQQQALAGSGLDVTSDDFAVLLVVTGHHLAEA